MKSYVFENGTSNVNMLWVRSAHEKQNLVYAVWREIVVRYTFKI